jgi:hypothetical protein
MLLLYISVPSSLDQVVFFAILPASIKGDKKTKAIVSKTPPLVGGPSGTLVKSTECRSLVIWGTNPASTVRSGSLTKQEREMMKFSPFQLSVIVGLILSDGYVAYSNKRAKSARLVFDQSLAHSPYF